MFLNEKHWNVPWNHQKWLLCQIIGGKTVKNVQIDPQTERRWASNKKKCFYLLKDNIIFKGKWKIWVREISIRLKPLLYHFLPIICLIYKYIRKFIRSSIWRIVIRLKELNIKTILLQIFHFVTICIMSCNDFKSLTFQNFGHSSRLKFPTVVTIFVSIIILRT